MNYNKTMFAGRLTRDPVLRYTPSNAPICEFTVASNRKYKDSQGADVDDTCYLDCVAYAKTAAQINQFFSKGKPLFIEGRLKYESWERDGVKRSKIVLVVEKWEFLGPPPKAADDGEGSQVNEQMAAPRRGAENPPAYRAPIKESDIPF